MRSDWHSGLDVKIGGSHHTQKNMAYFSGLCKGISRQHMALYGTGTAAQVKANLLNLEVTPMELPSGSLTWLLKMAHSFWITLDLPINDNGFP